MPIKKVLRIFAGIGIVFPSGHHEWGKPSSVGNKPHALGRLAPSAVSSEPFDSTIHYLYVQ
jgi:hypothetical protein